MKRKVLSAVAALLVAGSSLNAAVYATVDGKDVTTDDINVLLRSIPGAKFETLPKESQKRIIDQAIERKLLTKQAKKEGIQKDKEYKEALEKIKDELALEVWMKRKYEKINVSDKELKDFYNKNSDKFIQPAVVKARHILVKTEQEAKQIIKELSNAKGNLTDKFIELAKTKSTGPSGKNGGDLGWFNAKQMVKEFSEAAFALKKGEFTKTPVKTQFGYHVIFVEDKKDKEKVGFDKVKERILGSIKMEKFRDTVSKKAQELRSKAKIEYK